MEFRRKQLVNNPAFFLIILLLGLIGFMVFAELIKLPAYDGNLKEYVSLLEMIFSKTGQ